jgi:hypothetical protein
LTTFDPHSILDLIEIIGENCKGNEKIYYHSFCGHHHLKLLDTRNIFKDFREAINTKFTVTGLLYELTDTKKVGRVIQHSTFSPSVESNIKSIKEQGLNDLLNDACNLFKSREPKNTKFAVKYLWHAFERLKTYYAPLDKKESSDKIINDMSCSQEEIKTIFTDEFDKLTKIGNKFTIRHSEIGIIEINDQRHYDYFFNRCLALIATAIQHPEE